jgi:beta-mannosidase
MMDFQGKILLEKTQDVTVPELSSKVYAIFSREDLLKGTDAQHVFAVVDLMERGKVVSRNVFLFDRVRNLSLPSPSIQTELTGGGGSYMLRLQSPVLARHVYASFGDNDVEVSDNYLDLLPNEPITLLVKSKADLDKIRQSLKVRNITDAFSSEPAKSGGQPRAVSYPALGMATHR